MEFTGLQRLLQHTLVIAACLCVPSAPAWAQDKQPVPDAAAQARAQKLVRDVYGKEYDAAKTSKEKTELAKKLLDQATKSEGDPAGDFVLLRVAKDVSVLAGDAKTALDAVERIVATYDIDVMEIRLDCVKRLAAAAKLSSQYGALAEQVQFLIDVALADDDFETASQFGEIAQESARRARNYSLLKEIVARIKRCEELQQAHTEYRKAIARLEENPTDPEANLTAGRYLCFSKGDWEQGVSMLALGSDTALKAAAQHELAGPTDPVAQIELADMWYDLAESADKETKTYLLQHAGSWYTRAEPNVTTALQKAKLSRRLEEVAKIGPRPTEGVRHPVRPEAPAVGVNTRRPFDPATAEILATLQGHRGVVRSVAFSPDSAILVSGSEDHFVKFWDVAKAKFRAALPPFRETQLAVALSPKGSLLAVGNGDSTISLWDPSTRQLRGMLAGHTSRVRDVAFSGDGALLATGCEDKTVGIWQVAGGKLLRTFRTHEFAVTSVAISPDGSIVACGSRGDYIRVSDTATGELQWQQKTGPVGCLAFSADGSLLASGGKNAILLFDVVTKKLQQKLAGHTADHLCLAFTPDGATLSSGARDGTLRLWDVRSGELRRTLGGFTGVVSCVAFSPDGSVLALGDSTGRIQLWWSPPTKAKSRAPK